MKIVFSSVPWRAVSNSANNLLSVKITISNSSSYKIPNFQWHEHQTLPEKLTAIQIYEMLYFQICPAKSNTKFAVGRNRDGSWDLCWQSKSHSLFSIMGPFFILYSQRKEGGGKEERIIIVYSSYQRGLYNPCFSIVFLSTKKNPKKQ